MRITTSRRRRRISAFIATFVCLFILAAPETRAESEPSAATWIQIRDIAQKFVARESPPGILPFAEPSSAVLAAVPRTTLAHYFPPYPLSLDNRTADTDAYNRVLLNPTGGAGQNRRIGGYLRDRPLPAGPWASPWWRQINYAIEIMRAERIGLDGFECDLLRVGPGRPFNAWDRINMLMQTAAEVAPGFHIVIEPDSAALRSLPAGRMAEAIATLARYPSAYRLADGRLVIAPFAPENMGPEYWRTVLAELNQRRIRTAFIPVLLAWRREAASFAPFSFAMSSWGERDTGSIENGAFRGFFTAMQPSTSLVMMPIAPDDVRPKVLKFWETANTDAFRLAWNDAIRHAVRLVDLITWNDYSETSEISPSAGTQFVFYDLSAWFNDWYKTGAPPRIVRDAIYYCERTEIIPPAPQGSADFRRVGPTPVANQIEMLAFLTRPATLEIALNGHLFRREAPAGLQIFTIPAAPGQARFTIMRGGTPVVQVTSAWVIHDRFTLENPAYFGGSSNRPFIAVPPRVGNPDG